MSELRPPRFESRRRKEVADELTGRAHVWLPEWRPREPKTDFGTAVLEIAARLTAEVTQRLDKVPEKAFRGFLDWLGVRGQAGRAGRLPVVFSMAANAEPVLAEANAQLQALEVDPPVTFETEQPVLLVPGALASIVGADPANDAFYLPPAGFSALEAPKAVPNEWHVKSDAAPFATQLQLEPELGLDELPTLLHEPSQQQYRVTKAEGGIVTIEPLLGTIEKKPGATERTPSALSAGERLTRVSVFSPFGETDRNRQEHAIYIGSESLLNLEAEAEIEIERGQLIPPEVDWAYWGKVAGATTPDWQTLRRNPGANDSLILSKPAGDVEVLEIDGKRSRWLRGTIPPGAARDPVTVPDLKLTINCRDGAGPRPCPRRGGDLPSPVAIEAIAGTTPVVLDTMFYPLGREPRLFDAFYLGSAEAFSKKHARVEICFQVPDGTTRAYNSVQVGSGPDASTMLFGVGQDRQLHRIRTEPDAVRLAPVRPPFSEDGTAPFTAPPASLNVLQPARLTAVSRDSGDAVVAVTARNEAWLWVQNSTEPARSRWYRGGVIFDPADGPAPPFDPANPPSVVLLRDGAGLRMVGINHGVMYAATLPEGPDASKAPEWKRVHPPRDTAGTWRHVIPVFELNARGLGPTAAAGWFALDASGLSRFKDNSPTPLKQVGSVLADVAPLAIQTNANEILVIVQQDVAAARPSAGAEAEGEKEARERTVVAWRVTPSNDARRVAYDFDLEVVDSFDWHGATRDALTVVFAADAPTGRVLASWRPLSASAALGRTPAFLSPAMDLAHGAPGVIEGADSRIVTSGPQSEILIVPFHPDRARSVAVPGAAHANAWLIDGAGAPFAVGDYLLVVTADGDSEIVREATAAAQPSGSLHFFLPEPPVDEPLAGNLAVFRPEPNGTFDGDLRKQGKQLALDDGDAVAGIGRLVIIQTDDASLSRRRITDIKGTHPRKALLDRPVNAKGPVHYTHVTQEPSRAMTQRPALDLTTLSPDDIAAMQAPDADLYFDGAEPVQRVLFFHPAAAPHQHVVLTNQWQLPPDTDDPIRFVVAAVYGAPRPIVASKTASAELSWEYWDGSAWWTIQDLTDTTGNLLFNGLVSFCVPESLEATDVAGRTNHWIRARLVGGDYGRESVTVTSVVDANNPLITTQTVDRSLEEVVAPQIVWIDLYYSVCCAMFPDHVLTKDGGAIRGQTVANRTARAFVELFVPIAETIRRAGGAPAPPFPSASETPQSPVRSACVDCESGRPWTEATAPAEGGTSSATERALYLGFDTEFKGGPISILWLVDEGDHDGAYPLRVDVLRGNRFEPVVSQDGTRGLNESGVVTLTLAAPPVRTSLFGASRHWVRLRPNARFDEANWRPAIRAVYLNATWAQAAETQRDEPLGSSDGSPRQRVFLARPPVLRDSLRLRVREPLSEEEIDELRRRDPNLVIDAVAGRPGPWVLWSEVIDPADEAKDARVYSLDDETGEITFGDGLHGRIPPPRQDSIVAERYLRGGGDEANQVKAWSGLNLVTPLQGVERVAAPEGAAGGSDPQDTSTTIRFAPANLFMRDRALTLRDLETLALQFSPEIAQVRAIPARDAIALVVVMRGHRPQPSRATRRELARYLLERASPMLATRGVLDVKRPQPVLTHVALRLAIDAIEHSGEVAKEAARRISALLDAATGGADRGGWRLGAAPGESDIAAALDGAGHVDGIDAIAIEATGADGVRRRMPPVLKPTELAMLADDGVRVEFVAPQAEAVA